LRIFWLIIINYYTRLFEFLIPRLTV